MTTLIVEELIFSNLVKKVGMIPTREIISVWAGLKSARIGVSEKNISTIESAIAQLGLASIRSTQKYTGIRDIGKGGWANKFGKSLAKGSQNGDWLLYIAKNYDTAKTARDAEEDDREFDFGGALGIPECCAQFYLKNQNSAMSKQNDYVPFVLRNTTGTAPYNYMLNYVAQYFGYSLISFFPCSFECEHADKVARKTYEILARISPDIAYETLQFQKCSILYTEYHGLFAFEGAEYDSTTKLLHYDPRLIHGTLPSSSFISKQLIQGDRLEIISKSHVIVAKENITISEIRGENVSICIF